MQNRLSRPRYNRVIAGVCSGVANFFGLSVGLVRLLTIILLLGAGLSLWVYIILWIIMPSE